MKIGLTGHRPSDLPLKEYNNRGPFTDWLNLQLQKVIDKYKNQDLILIGGMALGSDFAWALKAIENDLPLIAAVPCDNQEKMWPKSSQDVYHQILGYNKCTKVVISPGPYAPAKMQARNIWMTDESDKMVGVWSGKTNGGTYNCIKYIKSVNKELIRIDPEDFYNEI